MSTRRRFLLGGLCFPGGPAALSAFPMTGCMRGVRASTPPIMPADNPITGGASLKAHAARHELFAGAAVNVKLLDADAAYRLVLSEQYDMVVAENEMKWGALRPSPTN